MNEKKQARLIEAQKIPLFNQLSQLNRLLKTYDRLDKNEVWQEITSFADNGISLKDLAATFKKTKGNFSLKVKPLKEVGLVRVEVQGKFKMMCPDYDTCLKVERFYNLLTEVPGQPVVTRKDVDFTISALANPFLFLVWYTTKEIIESPAVQQSSDKEYLVAIRALKKVGLIKKARVGYYQAIAVPELFDALDICFIKTGTIK